MKTKTELRHLQSAKAFYQSGGTGTVFPTYQAFAVFLRRHAIELCADSVFIPRRGSAASLVDPATIGMSLKRILLREGEALIDRIERG